MLASEFPPVGPAWLTQETHPFPNFEHLKSEKCKKSSSFFHFSDLRCSKSIEGLTRPGSPGRPHSFPMLSTSNRKNEKNLGFFSFFRFDVLKIDRGAHPALADPSQILSDPGQNPNFSEGLGIDLGVSESVQFAHFEPFTSQNKPRKQTKSHKSKLWLPKSLLFV